MSHPRSILRNRKTGEEFLNVNTHNATHLKKLRKPSLFTPTPQPSEPAEFTQFLRYFEQFVADTKVKNPGMPRDNEGNTLLDVMAKDMPNQYHRFGDLKKTSEIIHKLTLLNQKEELDEKEQQEKLALTASLSKMIFRNTKNTDNEYASTTGFLKHLGTTYLTAQLDSILPGSGLITGLVMSQMMASAAAQSSCPSADWQIQIGLPSGATKSACSSISGPYSTCSEGYLTCGDNPWVAGNPQFSVGAQLYNSNAGNAGAAITLNRCFNAKDVGEVVKAIIGNSTSIGPTVTCTNQMTPWMGFQPQVTASLPPNLCFEFYTSAGSVVQNCENWNQQAIWNTTIAFSIIGGVALIAASGVGVFYLLSNSDCRRR